jgi:hypothetical protein
VRRLQAGELADSTKRFNAFCAALAAKETREGTSNTWNPLFTRGLQDFRLAATYVDVTSTGDIQTDPSILIDSDASFFCTGALAFLILVLILAQHERKSLGLQDVLTGVPKDITGWEAIYKVLCKMFPDLPANSEAADLLSSALTVITTN